VAGEQKAKDDAAKTLEAGGRTPVGLDDTKVQSAAEQAQVAGEQKAKDDAAKTLEAGGRTPVGLQDSSVQAKFDMAIAAGENTQRMATEQSIETSASTQPRPKALTITDIQTNVGFAQEGGENSVKSRAETTIELETRTQDIVRTNLELAKIDGERNVILDSRRTLADRPNAGLDISSRVILEITENSATPYERRPDGSFETERPGSVPEYNPTRMQVFGHVASVPFRATAAGLDAVNNAVGRITDGLSGFASMFIGKTGARFAGGVLGSIGDAMDVLGIVQTFGDAMFYTQFMTDDVKFLNGQILRDVIPFSINQQLNAINVYNSKVDLKNNASPPPSETYAKIQYPLISGPLDLVESNSPFSSQVRVETEIDSVRERLLRTNTVHKQAFISILGQAFYDRKFNDRTKTLISYVNDNFVGIANDALYRDAFTSVCTYYKGVVFEDRFPDSDNTGRAGRARFQCGWGTPTECEKYASRWFNSIYTTKQDPPGNYAEWFNLTEFDTIRNADGSQVVPRPTFTNTALTGACIVTNSGVRSICRKYNGTYANHTCEYTVEYCQSIGTCFDKSTKSCYLPPDTMEALAIGFGTGGVREFIKLNGCQFESGMSNDPNRTALDNFVLSSGIQAANGARFVQDLIANQPHWNEGFRAVLKNPANSLNFTASVLGVGAFMGPVKFARFAGPLALLAGIAAVITGVIPMIRDTAEQRMKPTVDKQEYTTGGWNPDVSDAKGYMPKSMSFLDGWVTRPLKYHRVGQPNSPYSKVNEFPGSTTRSMFDTQGQGCDSNTLGTLASLLGRNNIAQMTCWQDSSAGPYKQVRAGNDKCSNQIVCIPAFPGESLKVDAIGPIATGSTKWLTSNVWTSGDYPGTPMFPSNPYAGDSYDNVFFYQLVYDKDKINQTTLWTNLSLMQQYFTDAMINNMRWWYCNKFIKSCPSGTCPDARDPTQWAADPANNRNINPKCYGYLSIETRKYKSLRMTLPGN